MGRARRRFLREWRIPTGIRTVSEEFLFECVSTVSTVPEYPIQTATHSYIYRTGTGSSGDLGLGDRTGIPVSP